MAYLGWERKRMKHSNKHEAQVVIAALRRIGVHPLRAADNPLMVQLVTQYAGGNMTDDQFKHACENMMILNPSLKATA